MRLKFRLTAAIVFAGLAAWLTVTVPDAAQAQAPEAAKAGGRGPAGAKGKGFGNLGMTPRDSRATCPKYRFEDTNEDLMYCVYASSKVSKNKAAPLIVSLHGLGAGPGVMMTKNAIDLAEAGGYVVVAPMGYNVGGWYGSPLLTGRGGAKGKAPKGNAPEDAKGNAPGGGAPPQPANLPELSEKDVMNVLAMIRKEYKIDDKRMYLMGHSMGGAGTLFLGSKHASMWAAIAAEAPAAFSMQNNRAEYLQKLKDAKVAVMIVHGDMDEAVPVANSRAWAGTMKELKMKYEYVEQPGISHGPVIESGMPPIYAFFAKHKK